MTDRRSIFAGINTIDLGEKSYVPEIRGVDLVAVSTFSTVSGIFNLFETGNGFLDPQALKLK